MNKYFIGILLMTVLAGCKQNLKGHEEKAGGSASKESVQTTSTERKNLQEQSIFQLTDSFQTQDAKPFTFSMLKGKPTVMAMIFTNCAYACPRITSDMKNIAGALKGESGKVNFVLVSFDTERDLPAQLKMFAAKMGLGKDWTLLHGSDESVRTLSVILNVRYEKDAEGNFSHSNLISVMDKNGVLQFQKEGLEADHTETIRAIQRLVQQP